MRIVLTGAGGMPRAVAAGLLAAGHDVLSLDAVTDADVVLSLPSDPSHARQPDVVRLCDAAARSGARMIFTSFSLLEPRGWQQAEDLVATGWAPNLIVRVAAPLGRQVDAAVCRTVATLLESAPDDAVRVLHVDDLVRFLVVAVESPHTGVVDLGAAGMCTGSSAQRALGGVTPRPKARGIGRWARSDCDMDMEKVHDLWGFECGWGAADALADTARGLRGRKLGVNGAKVVPGQFPLPAHHLNGVPADELGERINPRFPVFVAARFNHATSEPLSPMSLDLHLSGLRIAGRRLSDLLGLHHSVATEWETHLVGAFGQRIYFGASAVSAAQAQLGRGGMDLLGRLHPAVDPDVEIMLRPERAGPKVRRPVLASARLQSVARSFGNHVHAYVDTAARERLDLESLGALRDAQLNIRIRLLRNRIYEGWTLWAASLVLADGDPSPSAALVSAEIGSLVRVMRAHPYIATMLDNGDILAARKAAPMFATALDRAIARVGHHGPGEIDLTASVFADFPEVVVRAARQAMLSATPEPDSVGDALTLAWDSTMVFTHQLRLAVRELARRLAAAGQLAAADDIFYLTAEEALVMPADAEVRIKRRAAERMRLQGVRPPAVIEGEWVPLADPGAASIGTELRGRAGNPGSADGKVRVVGSVRDLPVHQDEIAVIASADTDYLVLMGTPRAVIVDGDACSFDSVTVPSVFLAGAARQLRTGTRAHVDATAGVVTVLAAKPSVDLIVAR